MIFLLGYFPPTRITDQRVVNFLSNRKPPPFLHFPKGAKVDVPHTKQFKQQKLTQLRFKGAELVHDFLGELGIKTVAPLPPDPRAPKGWKKVGLDFNTVGDTLVEFWGVSIISYQGQTLVVGEVSHNGSGTTQTEPIDMNDMVLRWQKDIEASSAKYKLDPAIIAALIEQESGGDPDAISPVGAIGLMQLMPSTARSLGVNPYDPAQNIDGGAHYIEIQLNRFGNLEAALAAYNAGPGKVEDGTWATMPETMNYVTNVPRLVTKYEQLWQKAKKVQANKH
ncbi:MAG TPA: lytic transglycosylase domain-containing protein [Desulfobacteria bacterium]|nr:lytic transglycosylase domain-containing protein [Desulfobacteria bacterium]